MKHSVGELGVEPGESPMERRKESAHRVSLTPWLLALLFGFLFLLPHLVRVVEIGSYSAYSPFTALRGSPMEWDQTFLYGPEANYSLTRGGAPAYSDTWEQRNAVYPYSILPGEFEALVAKAVGSLKNAFIVLAFVFPALTFLLLFTALKRCGATTSFAALLSAVVLLCAFSPRTLWLGDHAFLLHWAGQRAIDGLEQARTPNPNLTFPLFFGAIVCLAEAIRRQWAKAQDIARPGRVSPACWAALAGIAGGLLFYSYVYYAISWTAAVALLSLVALLKPRAMPRLVWLSFAITAALAVPFLVWKQVAVREGSYLARSLRLGMVHTHRLESAALLPTAEWAFVACVCAALWLRHRNKAKAMLRKDDGQAPERRATSAPAYVDALAAVLLASIAGGLAGLNMQLVTGFNVQAPLHFPHMVLQPLGLIFMAVVLTWTVQPRPRLRWAAVAAFALVMTAAAVAQFESARDSAGLFRFTADQRALFSWLNTHTPAGSVIATDDIKLSIVLPVQTHNSVLFSDGSRSTASDAELMERFLLASRLAGASVQQVHTELTTGETSGPGAANATYTGYLYESSPWEMHNGMRRIVPDRVEGVMQWFSSMNLAGELSRFRVDYLWTEPGRRPATVQGSSWKKAFSSADGSLWQLIRN
jgi:hypothetical protein